MKKFQIILFDHVGSGNSDFSAYDKNTYSSLYGYAKDVLDILEVLNKKNVIFVGHSVSAMMGMLASIQRPEYFDSLVIISPSSRYLNDSPSYKGGFEKRDIIDLMDMMEMNFTGWAGHLAPLVANNPEGPHIAREVERSFCSSNPSITRKFAEVTFLSGHRKDLADVTVPSLIRNVQKTVLFPLRQGSTWLII